MRDERLSKFSFNYKTNQNKKAGRPQKKWTDDIKKAMNDRGLEEKWILDRKKRNNTL